MINPRYDQSMGAAENKILIQQIFSDLARGDSKRFIDSMSDNFAWTVTGTAEWSKTFHGKQAVISELFGLLQAVLAGPVLTTADRIIADDDYAAVEAHGESTTRDGKPYNNKYCFVFHIAGGKLQAVTEYMDTELTSKTFAGALTTPQLHSATSQP